MKKVLLVLTVWTCGTMGVFAQAPKKSASKSSTTTTALPTKGTVVETKKAVTPNVSDPAVEKVSPEAEKKESATQLVTSSEPSTLDDQASAKESNPAELVSSQLPAIEELRKDIEEKKKITLSTKGITPEHKKAKIDEYNAYFNKKVTGLVGEEGLQYYKKKYKY